MFETLPVKFKSMPVSIMVYKRHHRMLTWEKWHANKIDVTIIDFMIMYGRHCTLMENEHN